MKNLPTPAPQNMLQDLETKLAGLSKKIGKQLIRRIKDKEQAGVALSPDDRLKILSAFMNTLTGAAQECEHHLQSVNQQLQTA